MFSRRLPFVAAFALALASSVATAAVTAARSGAEAEVKQGDRAVKAQLQKPLAVGMTYVTPPHQPGAKVRTPEGMAPLLVEWLQRHSSVQAIPVAVEQPASLGSKAAGQTEVDAFLLSLPADASGEGSAVIPTGYRAGIMAIMRTDTDIHRWEDLRGRTVCLTEESGLAGQLEKRYGAIEKLFRAPADALLDLRIGGCDATVHDSTMLHALLEFPEWQKFSARLPVQDERELAFIVPDHSGRLAQVLQERVQQWQETQLLNKLTQQAARDIAFEVYMDQEVPDCH